jgi:hypothetical protein
MVWSFNPKEADQVADENHSEDEIRIEDNGVVQRSASSLIFQSMDSTSNLAAGLGGLGVEIAAVKGKFGRVEKQTPPPDEPKKE